MKVIRVTRSSLSSASYFHADGFCCLFSRSSPPFLPFACTSLIWNFEWKFRSFSFPESKGWNRLGFKFRCNEIQSDFLHVVFLFFMRISIYRGRELLYGIVIIVFLSFIDFWININILFRPILFFVVLIVIRSYVLTTILVICDAFSFYLLRCASRKTHYYGDFIFEIGENNNLLTIRNKFVSLFSLSFFVPDKRSVSFWVTRKKRDYMVSVKIIIFINNSLVRIQLIIEIFFLFLTLCFIVLSIDIFISFIIEICNCILFSQNESIFLPFSYLVPYLTSIP